MKLFQISLKKLILLLVLSVSVLIIFIQLFCIGLMLDMFEEQKHATLNSMVAQSVISIENKLGTVSSLQNFISNNYSTRQLFDKSLPDEHTSSRRDFVTDLMFANRFFNDKISIILADTSGNFDMFLSKISNDEEKIIRSLYDEHIKRGISDTVFFTVESASYAELYMCSLQPIIHSTTDAVGNKNVGTSIVINRVNIYQLFKDMEYADNAGLVFESSDYNNKISFMNAINSKNALSSVPVKIHDTSYTITGHMIYKHQTSAIFKIIIMFLIELVVVILLFLIIHLSLLNKFITTPLHKIIRFMDNFVLHNTKERLVESGITEFSLLSHHINTMLDGNETVLKKIVSTQQKLYEAELSEKEAVFYSLQNQINPHFLYNTLESISGLALSGNTDKIIAVTDSLSCILRYALDYSSEATVDSEIEMLAEYSNILKARFANKVEIDFDFDDEIWERKILRMMLQPIVENSVKHGLRSLQSEKLTISIRGYEDNGLLIFTVLDNGCGISDDRLAEINMQLADCKRMAYSDTSIGIANIQRRIVLCYGDFYGVSIESKLNEYTKITIRMPLSE